MCALMFQLRQNVEGRQAFRQHIRNKCLLQSIISFVRNISIYSLKPSYFQENNLCFYFQQFILTNILTFGLAYPQDGFEAKTRTFTITPKNFTIDMIEPRQSGSCGLYIFFCNYKLANQPIDRMCTHQTKVKRNGKIMDFGDTWMA